MSRASRTTTLTDPETGDSVTIEPAIATGGGGALVSVITPSPGILLTPTQVREVVRHMQLLIGDADPSPETARVADQGDPT